MRFTSRWRTTDGRLLVAEQQDLGGFVRRIVRCAGNLPPERFEIFRRLYVVGERPDDVMASMSMSHEKFEIERSAVIRSLMRSA